MRMPARRQTVGRDGFDEVIEAREIVARLTLGGRCPWYAAFGA